MADYAICSYNLITNNTVEDLFYEAEAYGGGIAAYYSAQIVNNTIVGNKAIVYGSDWYGGGVSLHHIIDSIIFKNNIVADNIVGGGIYIEPHDGIVDANYNCIWGNEPFDYSPRYPVGSGDIFLDPLFVNPDSGDYHPQEDSPCIDAGDPDSPLDPDSTRADIGCYYYDHGTDIFEPDSANSPHKFYLEQNYPNPFNGQTVISYFLPEDSDVELNVINMRGELVLKPVNSHQSAGKHSLVWQGTRTDGKPVATGIYFYGLKVKNSSSPPSREVKAMILLK